MVTTVSCPVCKKRVVWSTDNIYRPFCSNRCKQIDLGAWATEDYKIPVEGEIDDVLDQKTSH